MNYEDAISEVYTGSRMRPSHWQAGIYLEHSFSRGVLKCWPVERVEDEPIRTQQDYRSTPQDEAATDWAELPRVFVPLPPRAAPLAQALAPKPVTVGWGNPLIPPKSIPNSVVAFCSECDFEISSCKCTKVVASGWGNPLLKKEPGKWG